MIVYVLEILLPILECCTRAAILCHFFLCPLIIVLVFVVCSYSLYDWNDIPTFLFSVCRAIVCNLLYCNSSLTYVLTKSDFADETGVVNALESVSWSKIPDAELCKHASQLPSCQAEELYEQHDYRGTSRHLLNPAPDVVNAQRKAGKMPRSSSGCSKRARVAQLEDSVSSAGVDDVKDITDKLGSYSTKCNVPGCTFSSPVWK